MWELGRHRGVYVATKIINGRRIRRSLSTEDKGRAEQRLKDFNNLDSKGGDTVKDAYFAYREEKMGTGEYTKLEIMWRPLSQTFEGLRPDQVDKDVCKQYSERRRFQGKSNNTIIRELGSLRAALRSFNKNLPKSFYMPPKPPPKDIYLTRDQYNSLLKAAKAPHMKLFIILALSTGARSGALFGLTWDRINFERKLIDLGKGTHIKKRAVVPMNEAAEEALREAYKARLSDHVIEFGGKGITTLSKGFYATMKRAGLEKVTPNVLRHTAAVWMAESGVPMTEIAQYLGHTSTDITYKVYAKYSPDYLRKAANVLQ